MYFFILCLIVASVFVESLYYSITKRLRNQPKINAQTIQNFQNKYNLLQAKEELRNKIVKVQKRIMSRLFELENIKNTELQKRNEKLKQKKERKELDTLINLSCRSRSKIFNLIENPNIPLDFQNKIDEFSSFTKFFNDRQSISFENFVKDIKNNCIIYGDKTNDSALLVNLLLNVTENISLDGQSNFEDHGCVNLKVAIKIKILNEFLETLEYCKQVSSILKRTKKYLEEFNMRFLFIGGQLENWFKYRDKISVNQKTICAKLTSFILMWFVNYRLNNQKRNKSVLKFEQRFRESKNDTNFTLQSSIQIIYDSIEKKSLNLYENPVICLQNLPSRYKENNISHQKDNEKDKSMFFDHVPKLETIAESYEKEN